MDFSDNNAFKRNLLCSAFALCVGFATQGHADYYIDAQESFKKGELNAAVIQLKNLLQENSDNASARLLLGQIYLQRGNAGNAQIELEKAKTLGATDSELLLPMGRLKLLQSKPDDILNTIKVASFQNSDDIRNALNLRGHAHLAKNQFADANESFNAAQKQGESAYGYLGLARVSYIEKEVEQSLSYIEKALQLEPNNKEVLFTKAQILSLQKKYEEATSVFTQLIEQPGLNAAALLARAEIYVRTNKIDEAKKDLTSLLELNAMLPQANFMMSRIQLEQKDYAGAQVSAEKVLRVIPNHALSMFVLGAAHYDQENYEQARLHLEGFVAKQPNHIIAARLLGATYLKMGDPTSAVDFMEALDQNVEIKDALFLNVLGRAHLQSGDFEKGTAALKRALEIDPNLKDVRRQLAIGQFAAGNSEEALKGLENSYSKGDESEQTSIMLILSYLKLKKFDAAIDLIERSIQLYPKTPTFLSLKGISAERQNDLFSARKAYEQALIIDKQYIPSLLSLAKLDAVEGDIPTAKKRYETALEINPKHLQALIALSAISLKNGDTLGFVDKLEMARDSNPHAIAPVNLLVNYYLQQQKTGKALSEATKFEIEHPKNIQALSLLARVQIAKKDFANAKYNLQSVIDNNPKDILHRVQLAQILAQEKAFPKSLELLNQITEIDPGYIPAYLTKAVIMLNTQGYEEAADIVTKIEELSPESFLSEQLRGDIAKAQDKAEEAFTHYENAFSRSKTPYLANELFNYYRKVGDTTGAIKVFEDYLAVVPNDSGAKLKLAAVYQGLERNKDAISIYEGLYQQSPNSNAVVNNLAWLYWLEKDKRSLEYAQKAHQLSPDTPEIMDTLGWIMLHLGDKKEALKHIQNAASRMPTNGDVRYHLAVALNNNGKQSEARKELKRLLKNNQNFSEIANARSLLKEIGE